MFSMKIFSMKFLGEENPGEEFTMRRKFRHENSIDIIVVEEYSIDQFQVPSITQNKVVRV